jgi:hypothetical protein
MKANKCIKCENKTFQKDGLCVVCRIGISTIYVELTELLKTGKAGMPVMKASHSR